MARVPVECVFPRKKYPIPHALRRVAARRTMLATELLDTLGGRVTLSLPIPELPAHHAVDSPRPLQVNQGVLVLLFQQLVGLLEIAHFRP